MMQTLCPADIEYATRAIAVLPRDTWDAMAEHLIRSVVLAEDLHRLMMRAHPVLGDGTLTAVLALWPMAAPEQIDTLTQAEVLAALSRAVIRVCNSGSAAVSDPR